VVPGNLAGLTLSSHYANIVPGLVNIVSCIRAVFTATGTARDTAVDTVTACLVRELVDIVVVSFGIHYCLLTI